VKLKSPMKSTDISVSFADMIKKVMEEEKGNKAEEAEGPKGDEEEAEGEEVGGGGGKEGSQIEVEEGRGKPEEMGTESGVAEEGG
jgi:hypothetical protein